LACTFGKNVPLLANGFVGLPVGIEHFNQWLKLFYETVDENFEGEKAERMKWQGQRMAEMFHSKIEYYKNNPSIPLL
jgi:hemoglobin